MCMVERQIVAAMCVTMTSFHILSSYISAHKVSMQRLHLVLSCVTVLACPHDLHPSVDLSYGTPQFSSTLSWVFLGSFQIITHWSVIIQCRQCICNVCYLLFVS